MGNGDIMVKKKKTGWNEIDNKYELIGYLFKYHLWKIIVVLLTIAFIISMFINIGYNQKEGFFWKPADISINRKIKE